jgi:hypothetical protein
MNTQKMKTFICAQLLLVILFIGCKTTSAQKETSPGISSEENAVRHYEKGVNYNKEKNHRPMRNILRRLEILTRRCK